MAQERDHGGGLDAAVAKYGGLRSEWIDLSTGINPTPYPIPALSQMDWTALPDRAAADRLIAAARMAWNVPDDAAILATPGASAAIAQIPRLAPQGTVHIPAPTYNEHAASFANAGWTVNGDNAADARVLVHPNNPDGRHWNAQDMTPPLMVIDESFCDVTPEASLIAQANRPGALILKSFGKFWGLAGVRLGFVIGDPVLIARLTDMLGPWPVSGIALNVGATALEDRAWADATRTTLAQDANRLDTLMQSRGAELVGGTTLFRLYDVGDAAAWQARLAQSHVWSRIFPYSNRWLRLGLPPAHGWSQLESAL
ncbi:pyridoxal phosphate-dependent class II aminotransferase [Tateyamaria omphalii]|uniref:threonine-phosphate decarboxylase n=1 Tax=Tateyamaria omphalii TaxID=299262 RepID=UPI001C998D2F|nr:threonine-phosphate decarboxylase [Tateyamaria omphalii]MBY5934538.1 pyridoxal phosphate-dependent class II aminotransferase [Tateyamaria omphalii]